MSYISDIDRLLVECSTLIGLKIRVVKETPEYVEFDRLIRAFFNGYGLLETRQWENIERYLLVRGNQYLSNEEAREIIISLLELKKLKQPLQSKFDRIFISHSTADLAYVKPLVELLEKLGLTSKTLFCSSVPGYGIPIGHNIYHYLKDEFTDKNILVLMLLSDNYYESKPSLNEMGATWVMSKEYIMILLKDFDYSKIQGAVDPRNIGFKIDDISRLDEFKNKVIEGMKLPEISHEEWSNIRSEFLNSINNLCE